MFKSKFRKYNGEIITDIIQYLHDYIEKDPTITITVGCDSMQRRSNTVYAITVMLYNKDIRHGAHVVFFRERHTKIRDRQQRLYNEAKYLHDVGMYLDSELSAFYKRQDLTEIERKKYKYHVLKCEGNYANVENYREEAIIKNLSLSPSDYIDYKLVDIHVDFNPFEGSMGENGFKNKSYVAYKSYVPWLKGIGFRTWSKPAAHASSTAADLLVK